MAKLEHGSNVRTDEVCPTSEVAENSVKSFEVGNNVIAVYNVGGTFYATDNECTHGAASLADGILEDDIIECTLHFGAFNVKTGEAVQAPCFTPLRTYKVVVQDGQVCVDLDKTRRTRPDSLSTKVLGLAAPIAAPAIAQDFPTRPITLVLPFPAGSGIDVTARLVGDNLSTRLGQPVVVENKAGANGVLAATAVARAAPDGYTIFMTTNCRRPRRRSC